MRVEDCIVSIKKRSFGGCLDLGVTFVHHFAGPILRLTLVFAIPSLVLTWVILQSADYNWSWALTNWLFFSTMYSGALIAGMGRQVFGQPFRIGGALRAFRSRCPSFLLISLLVRALQFVGGLCLVFPAALLVPNTGFLAEVIFLEQPPLRKVSTRLNHLVHGSWSAVLGHFIALFAFSVIFVIGLFQTTFLAAGYMFNTPCIVSRLDPQAHDLITVSASLLADPLAGTIFQACMWAVLPLSRLAWFFVYLDMRTRSECWDLDVACQVEANRLEGQA